MLPDILHFRMERHTDEGVYYVISGVEIKLVTDGETIEDALHKSPYAGYQIDPHPARCARLPPPNSGEGANRSVLAPLLEFGEGSGVGSEITICVRCVT